MEITNWRGTHTRLMQRSARASREVERRARPRRQLFQTPQCVRSVMDARISFNSFKSPVSLPSLEYYGHASAFGTHLALSLDLVLLAAV